MSQRLSPNSDSCARLKTAIAAEVGNIQATAERYIAESSDYLRQRIPQSTFGNTWGEQPRKIRYSTAPIPDADYVDMLVDGDSTQATGATDCLDAYSSLNALTNKRGAFGCNIPGQTIRGGYDVFYRTLKGKAWETEPCCAMDLILKFEYNDYINMLRTDLPRRAMEQFNYSLARNVIQGGRYNTSAVNGFITGNGFFPALPTGTLDLGTMRRLAQILRVQGWDGPFEVLISQTVFDQMRLNYKNNNGIDLIATPESNETHHLGEDVQVINWGGIRWVMTDRPDRGFLKPNADGTYTLVPVRPTTTRLGTGGGVVVDVNEDYFNCYTICEGVRYEVYEVSYYVHPRAANRQAFAMPQVANKSFMNNLFNFSVRMIDGAFIPCNIDNFKFLFRLLHAYAFESTYPELMGAVVHRVAPEQIFLNTPTCNSEGTPTPATVNPYIPVPIRSNGCNDDDRTDDCAYNAPGWLLPQPTEQNPDPANVVGELEFYNEGPLITGQNQTVRVYVERIGGTLGAASVHLATADGTAAAGTDYTAENATLNWADGEAGRKYLDVPISAVVGTGKSFTVVRSSATGSTWNGATSVTVTIDNIP
jgi:hypothetical protein